MGIDGGTGGLINTMRPAGDDNASGEPQFIKSRVAGENLGRYAEFPDLSSDKMTVLTACVEYRDLRDYLRLTYFRIRWTMIFRALDRRASAFGRASRACSTSGSVLISYLRLSSTLNAVW